MVYLGESGERTSCSLFPKGCQMVVMIKCLCSLDKRYLVASLM